MDGILDELEQAMYGQEDRATTDGFYIRVSGLIPMTATEYVRNFGVPNDIPKHYALRGNAMSEAALKRFGSLREMECWKPLPSGVPLVGHPDCIKFKGHEVATVEFKTHEDAAADKVEMAKRQGLLNLGLLWDMIERGEKELHPAKWAPPEASIISLDEIPYRPSGTAVVVATWDWSRKEWFPTSVAEIETLTAFYVAKAEAIVQSIRSKDMTAARAWDEAHPLEFARSFEKVNDPPIDLDTLIPAFGDLDEKLGEMEKLHKDMRAEVIAALTAIGSNKEARGAYEVKLVRTEGRRTVSVKDVEAAGLHHLIKQGEPGFQVRPGRVKSS